MAINEQEYEAAKKAGYYGGPAYRAYSSAGGEALPGAISPVRPLAGALGIATQPAPVARTGPSWAQRTPTQAGVDYGREYLERPAAGVPTTAIPAPSTQKAQGVSGPGFMTVSRGGTEFTGAGPVSGYAGEWTGAMAQPGGTGKRGGSMVVSPEYFTGGPSLPLSRELSAAREAAAARGDWRAIERSYMTPEEKAAPDIGSMTIPQLMAFGIKTKRAGRAQEQAGALALEGMRQAGEAERVKTASALRREPTALELAQAEEVKARTGALAMSSAQAKRRSDMIKAMQDPRLTDQARAELRKDFEFEFGSKERGSDATEVAKLVDAGILTPEEGRRRLGMMADGGVVRGFANGGAITEPITQTQQVNPAIAQYGQYLNAAAQSGIAPVPFAQYMNLLQSTRGAMQTTPTQFADGGDVSALGRPLEGPGTGRSDSIPATINGTQPAALSDGEFVIPAHVVKAKGTEFFEKLLAQYAEGEKANG